MMRRQGGANRIVLDISRTIARAAHAVPTGIDRVELAYAEALIARMPERLDFAAMHPVGRFGMLPHPLAVRFIETVAQRWRQPGHGDAAVRGLARRLRGAALLRSVRPPSRGTYLLTSHHHLDRTALIARLRAEIGQFACFIHDLIPMQFPEYARPGEPERHAQRMRSAAGLADQIIVNSADTAAAFAGCLRQAGRDVPVVVAPLGIERMAGAAAAPQTPPVFLFIGTIEPRKNHLLALNLWRQMANTRGPATPRLILIGRRGWENENILDMLDRCPALRGVVEERNTLSDAEMRMVLASACAVILPSFAEGYGLPVAEALDAGVPVICSDLPALREVGGTVPDYLDPLDGTGWRQAIEDYAEPGSARRAAQLQRLRHWQPPGWDAHMDAVLGRL